MVVSFGTAVRQVVLIVPLVIHKTLCTHAQGSAMLQADFFAGKRTELSVYGVRPKGRIKAKRWVQMIKEVRPKISALGKVLIAGLIHLGIRVMFMHPARP